jgi:hypothetical protein
MKKTILILVAFTLGIIVTSCSDSINNPADTQTGEIALFTLPAGATISIDGIIKGVTPDTITTAVGLQHINFSLANYKDTTVGIAVSADNMELLTVNMIPIRKKYGLVKIWETGNNSTADEPSGIDLSAGTAVSISGADSLASDMYYTGSNFTIRSAGYLGANYRVTHFKAGSATNIDDGLDSPSYDGTWDLSMPDDVGNYYFLYDNDGNYTKFKVVNAGGEGTWDHPKWVEVEWIYIQAPGVTSF